jgi:hypothetical protein
MQTPNFLNPNYEQEPPKYLETTEFQDGDQLDFNPNLDARSRAMMDAIASADSINTFQQATPEVVVTPEKPVLTPSQQVKSHSTRAMRGYELAA